MVFTEAYHLKRGYCCQSGCKHCPYDFQSTTQPCLKEPPSVPSPIMSLNQSPELQSFLSTYFSGSDAESDTQSTESFMKASSIEKQNQVIAQAKDFIEKSNTIVEDLGMEANRWFGDAEEAKLWLESIISLLGKSEVLESVVTKDSNGSVLNEGDAVTVIKDLKVKGGSSDLKRGDLIKKIHLIGDPDNIECNVNGSTLVLKTMFLKKA